MMVYFVCSRLLNFIIFLFILIAMNFYNFILMIERAESKSLLILLLLLSILALLCSLTTLTLELLWNHVGFLMSSANYTSLCSTYQTLKLHYNVIYNYNAIFLGCCASILFQLLTLIHLIYLVVSFCKKQERYLEELTESVFQRLYIGYSMSLLGICIGVGYYFSYIIEEGWNCLNYTYVEWMILGSIFFAALVFLLICWIYLLCFWSTNKHKFDQPKEKTSILSLLSQPVEKAVVAGQRYEEIQQELKFQPQDDTKQINQSLLGDAVNPIQEEQKVSLQSNDKQKLAIIPFEDYIKKEKEKEDKEKRQMELIFKLLQHQEEKIKNQQRQKQAKMKEQRIRKQNFKNQALSPDDPNFDKMFVDSEEQSQKEVKEEQKPKPFFPANFHPKNQKERQQFQQYKKSLLDEYVSTRKPSKNSSSSNISALQENDFKRHPQNIEGGRSKRLMNKYMSINKRPVRNLSMYAKTNRDLQKSIDKHFPMIQEQNEYSDRSINPFKIEPQILFEAIDPMVYFDRQPTFQQPKQIKKQFQEKPPNLAMHAKQTLCFHKSKAKSPSRKILFEQQQKFFTNQNFTSILNSLVRGVEQSNMTKKVKQLRQKRYRKEQGQVVKPGEILLDEIRSKYP